jgi:hypothetical protein
MILNTMPKCVVNTFLCSMIWLTQATGASMKVIEFTPSQTEDMMTSKCTSPNGEHPRLEGSGQQITLVSARHRESLTVIMEDGEMHAITGNGKDLSPHWAVNFRTAGIRVGDEPDGPEMDMVIAVYVNAPDDVCIPADESEADDEGEDDGLDDGADDVMDPDAEADLAEANMAQEPMEAEPVEAEELPKTSGKKKNK